MTRYFRLADSQDFNKEANANLTVADEIQQSQPGRVCQRSEEGIQRETVARLGHAPRITQYIRLDRYEMLE
jgi:hypothetical protein